MLLEARVCDRCRARVRGGRAVSAGVLGWGGSVEQGRGAAQRSKLATWWDSARGCRSVGAITGSSAGRQQLDGGKSAAGREIQCSNVAAAQGLAVPVVIARAGRGRVCVRVLVVEADEDVAL